MEYRCISTRGIDIGKPNVLICGNTLRGTKYVPRTDGSGVDLIKVVCILLKVFWLHIVLYFILYITVE